MHFGSDPMPYKISYHTIAMGFGGFVDRGGYLIQIIAFFCIFHSLEERIPCDPDQPFGIFRDVSDRKRSGSITMVPFPDGPYIDGDDISLFNKRDVSA